MLCYHLSTTGIWRILHGDGKDMAFVTDVREFQALLDACSSTQEWQRLMDSVLIPDEWMAMAYARLTELTVQEFEVS